MTVLSQPTPTFWQRLANHPVYVLIALAAAIAGLVVFATGKNLPDLLHSGGSATASPYTPRDTAHPPSTSVTNSSAATTPPADAATSTPAPPETQSEGDDTPPPAETSVSAPSTSAIETCINALNGGRSRLADYNLTEAELGIPASLSITVAAGDDPYVLWVEDDACNPTPLATFAPGAAGTFTLYRGAVWDFVRQDGTGTFTGAPGPINPSQPGPFVFEDHATKITISTP